MYEIKETEYYFEIGAKIDLGNYTTLTPYFPSFAVFECFLKFRLGYARVESFPKGESQPQGLELGKQRQNKDRYGVIWLN